MTADPVADDSDGVAEDGAAAPADLHRHRFPAKRSPRRSGG